MASTPEEVRKSGLLEFHVRAMAGGTVSPRLFALAGKCDKCDKVRVEGPFGIAYYRTAHTGPILALAGGSGLAPVKGTVESALNGCARGPEGRRGGKGGVREGKVRGGADP